MLRSVATALLVVALGGNAAAQEPGPSPEVVPPQPDLGTVEIDILQASCDNAFPKACYELAGRYLAGRGVERDVERGLAIMGSACEHGSGVACHALGDLRANGVFGPVDPTGAAPFYRRACLVGHQVSCARVRVEYVAPDTAESLTAPEEDPRPLDILLYAQTGIAQIRPEPLRFPTAATFAAGVGGTLSRSRGPVNLAGAFDFAVGVTDVRDLVFDARVGGGVALRTRNAVITPLLLMGVDAVGSNSSADDTFHLPVELYGGAELRARLSYTKVVVQAGAAWVARLDEKQEIRLEAGVGWRRTGQSALAFTIRLSDLDGALVVGGYLTVTRLQQK